MGDFIGKTTPPVEKEYLPVAGMTLNKPLTQEYKKVVSYIKSHTTPSDYIYNYPDGPYNQLTDRRTPVAVTSISYYGIMPQLTAQILRELATHKPAYVIINKYNAYSYYSSLNGYNYNVYAEGKNIIIDGYVTEVEDYIQQNYELVKKFPIAWVLKRRDTEKPRQRMYEPIKQAKQWEIITDKLEQESNLFGDSQNFRVLDNDFKLFLATGTFDDISMLSIPIKVDLGLIKSFSKFVFNVGVVTNDNRMYLIRNGFISSDWQDIVVYIPKVEKPLAIQAVVIQVPSNKGFLLWGKPASVQIKIPEAYSLNTRLNIDDSIFVQQ